MVKKGIRPELVEVIDNGIEDEAYVDVEAEASEEIKKKVASYGRYIVQIGRIYPIKNYETTIRALALLPADVKFVIAGQLELNSSKDYVPGLERLIKELHLEDRVLFIGVVRGVDKYYLIKKAQMMVHMALWESFCNVVHEGLSQGLVCIVANNTALPYLIKDGVNGYCVETKDFQAVAEKASYVLDNADLPEIVAMKERNRKYGLENSWRNVAARMDTFYIGAGRT
jgi:glycosyltransferase involved in cell wall biosynthesis